MSKHEKLLSRLARIPADFEWDELVSLLSRLGFEMTQGAGSRVRFSDPNNPARVIHLHEPHGRSPKTVLRSYLRNLVNQLREWGFYG
jgi:predicted RNA binding protein YcfA (HicA-like mRNA interferase family)